MIDALDIHREDPIPLRLFHLAHESVAADARVADQNIHIAHRLEGGVYRFAICHITADAGCAGLFGNAPGSGMIFFVEEKDGMSQPGK